MLSHDEVWSAIDALAHNNGLSPSGLARRSGLDPTTFNKSKRFAPDGRPRWPSTESIAKILRATNTPVSALFGRDIPSSGSASMAVPLLGEAHAGFDLAEPGLKEAAMLPRPPRIINFPDARYDPLYALTVVGDSMNPLYRNGDVLFISAQATPQPGDRVIVKLADGEVVVKVLQGEADGSITFHAVNPQHSDVSVESGAVDWMAKIVYATQ